MTSVQTSQGFIRALKAPYDPPVNGGQLKIEIARQVWDDCSFHVPNKAEVVVEWIISKFLKEKDQEITSNPLVDLRFWTLLRDVLLSSNPVDLGTQMRPLKIWLPPLLSRLPLAPVVVGLFQLLSMLDSDLRRSLTPAVFTCLTVIWPTSAQKMNSDTMLECFSAFLTAYHGAFEADNDFVRIGSLVAASYRNFVLNASNKKKIYSAFMQQCFPVWLKLMVLTSSKEPEMELLIIIYDAGIETLFNLDVLRQARDSRTEDVLFKAIIPVLASNSKVYPVLPRLFASYIKSIRKYCSALVSQDSTEAYGAVNSEIQTQGMQFLASCISLLDPRSTEAWSIKVALLVLVDKESLFDRKNSEAEMLIDRVIGQALASIDSTSAPSDLAVYGIECLSMLARIDYDKIVILIPRIFPKLFTLHGSDARYRDFLNLILEYHSKTRTLDTYIQSLMAALLEAARFHDAPPDFYRSALLSPLLDTTHLQHLSKAIQIFLSGSQALPATEALYSFLKDAWEKFDITEPETEERPSKRRKTIDVNIDRPAVSHAAVFSLSVQFAVAIFSSFPVHAIIKGTRDELCAELSEIRDFARRTAKKTTKAIKKCNSDRKWPLSIVAAASLRLWYALDISGYISVPTFDDERLCKKAMEALKDEKLLPELFVELSRLLFHVSLDRESTACLVAFDYTLEYLEKNFTSLKSGIPSLDNQECALSLMHMIMARFLPVIENFASAEQLKRLIQIFMCVEVYDTGELPLPGLQAENLVLQTLHSAQFWELPNIRVVFLDYLSQVISALDVALSNSSVASVTKTVGAYRILLSLPVEYLSRSTRADFTRKAFSLDRHITASSIPIMIKERHLTVLRAFLSRVFMNLNGTDLNAENLCVALEHLLSWTTPLSMATEGFVGVTMSLIELVVSEMLKKSETPISNTVLSIVRSLGQIDVQSVHHAPNIRCRALACMIQVLERDFKFINFPDDLQSELRRLYQTLSVTISPHISALIETTSVESTMRLTNFMTLWRPILCLRKWIGGIDDLIPSFGSLYYSNPSCRDGASSLVDEAARLAALAVLLEEFIFCPENDRMSRLDFTAAALILTYKTLSSSARLEVDGYISKMCSSLTVPDFSQMLEHITDGLKNGSVELRGPLIQISTVLLRSHPQGTMKPMQAFLSHYLQTVLGWRDLTDGPPAVLRTGDMGSIWTLIAVFLSGSHVHDEISTLDIFHKIASIISALIRLRRDLVTHTLPHLGSVLRQLLMTVRTARPNLGIKQITLVTDTLPRWLTADHPIGLDEVKVLSRLLETLTAKSMIRNHNTSNLESHKAESLAKPFSKHAAFVLKAYVTALNDPLCLLPPEHRKELQGGLCALCSMISDHSRDALMVGGLDAGGKTTMKMLWKEYEKQKYVGKG